MLTFRTKPINYQLRKDKTRYFGLIIFAQNIDYAYKQQN